MKTCAFGPIHSLFEVTIIGCSFYGNAPSVFALAAGNGYSRHSNVFSELLLRLLE